MELAEVSGFRSDYLTVADVVDGWKVSERTLRRRLAAGVNESYQDRNGQWLLSARWADAEFRRKTQLSPLIDAADEAAGATDRDEWIRELLESEARASRAEATLEVLRTQVAELKAELQAAKLDLDYERSLIHRLKDQLRQQPGAQPGN